MFVAHMIARRIPHRYPRIRFIVPHLGGPIPMPLNRLDKQGVRDLAELAELPSVTARRFWTTPCPTGRRLHSPVPVRRSA